MESHKELTIHISENESKMKELIREFSYLEKNL